MAPSAIPSESITAPASKQVVPKSGDDAKRELTPPRAISQGVCLPGIPTFPLYENHRAWILEQMARAFRVSERKGYTEGMSGHISVRDPEHPHTFWTNPLGKHFATPKASDIVLVNYN